jgi:hypothetical protein
LLQISADVLSAAAETDSDTIVLYAVKNGVVSYVTDSKASSPESLCRQLLDDSSERAVAPLLAD